MPADTKPPRYAGHTPGGQAQPQAGTTGRSGPPCNNMPGGPAARPQATLLPQAGGVQARVGRCPSSCDRRAPLGRKNIFPHAAGGQEAHGARGNPSGGCLAYWGARLLIPKRLPANSAAQAHQSLRRSTPSNGSGTQKRKQAGSTTCNETHSIARLIAAIRREVLARASRVASALANTYCNCLAGKQCCGAGRSATHGRAGQTPNPVSQGGA